MITTTFFLRVTLLALGLAFTGTTTTALVLPSTTALELSPTNSPTNNSSDPLILPRSDHWECKNYASTVDESSRISPRWGDCTTMLANVQAKGALWKFPNWNGAQYEVAHYMTCAFGITVLAGQHPQGSWAKVGNHDLMMILDLIRGVKIKNVGGKSKDIDKEAKVGGKGRMECYLDVLRGKTFEVEWGLYHYCPHVEGLYC
ncbi:hypothetical protein QBC32DRAFT_265845 [Pseudoneurospora amorphoporcata]|uniref:Ecp2 effector protein-like domain-containing protein n=1 Tax=Pseudoneurospora amorphoporcata TaxID=241081 RepID=A0AAN6SEC6_9PEZI|nr:hypothetical protein QBC32DRAFT_265845 [Pseudoneurospora amorphoporcata]